jgi:hypothetical protein
MFAISPDSIVFVPSGRSAADPCEADGNVLASPGNSRESPELPVAVLLLI